MKYSELADLIENTEEFLFFLKTNPKAVELPSFYFYNVEYVTEYHKDENGYKDYSVVDEFRTHSKMRRIAKALRNAKKNYNGDSFSLSKTFGESPWRPGSITIAFQTTRQAVCRKVVKEVKEIPEEIVPSKVIPARTEEVVEWVCDDPLLAAK